MSDTPGRPVSSAVSLPPGLRIAGIGVRFGAWVLDLFFFGLVSLIPASLAVITGAVSFNPDAIAQVRDNPNVSPTVPYLFVDIGPLVVLAAIWVALAIAYAALGWALYRGTPGQRILSLQVADPATGLNLSLARATWRAVLVSGIPAAATAVVFVAMCKLFSVLVPADFQASGSDPAYLDRAGIGGAWSSFVSLCAVVAWSWSLVLLLTSAFARDKRGIHDRLSHSVVVGRSTVPWAAGHPSAYAPPQPWAPPQSPSEPPIAATGLASGYPVHPQAPAAWGDRPETSGDAGQEADEQEPGSPGAQPRIMPQRWDSGQPTISNQTPGSTSLDGEPLDAGRQGPLGARLSQGLRIAGFNRRVVAYAIDSGILLLWFALVASVVESGNAGPPPEREAMIAGLGGGVIQLVYFVATWSLWRGSVGQKLVGLKTVAESGGRLSVFDALARWALLQGPFALTTAVPSGLGGIVLFAAMIWAVTLGWRTREDPDGQGFHDRVSHSLVVEDS